MLKLILLLLMMVVDEGFESELVTLDILSADFGESSEYYLTTSDSQRNIFVIDSTPHIVTTPGEEQLQFLGLIPSKTLLPSVTETSRPSNNVIIAARDYYNQIGISQSEFGFFSIYMYEYYFNYPADYELVAVS